MISDPTHMALGACCIGFAPTPYRLNRHQLSDQAHWLAAPPGAGSNVICRGLAPGEGASAQAQLCIDDRVIFTAQRAQRTDVMPGAARPRHLTSRKLAGAHPLLAPRGRHPRQHGGDDEPRHQSPQIQPRHQVRPTMNTKKATLLLALAGTFDGLAPAAAAKMTAKRRRHRCAESEATAGKVDAPRPVRTMGWHQLAGRCQLPAG